MNILVTQNFSEQNPGISRVSTFKTKNELHNITGSLNVPYYVYRLDLKLEKAEFMELLNGFRNISVQDVLDAEAAKFCKKKYNTELDCILDHIIMVG